ncbi:MAG: hypothetical protein B9J98_01140 [Candidatus Terraquivivens tikiterensis]|uniref:Heavy-metal chelation domain-containing protein n=1 Tax=Candidatus Terraquivivens tikiterensis TaxID=1980982 RepID=A0A2R7Y9M5_9ARCH|nr:MAG: hypothetical protein B9J98_01140 [Candidatus Terraquivivens tikiterensis]
MTGLIRELVESLSNTLRDERLEDVRVGIFYTGVKLSSGHAGVAYTMVRGLTEAACCPKVPMAGELSGMSAAKAIELAEEEDTILSAVGIATINAASQSLIFGQMGCRYNVLVGYDALDAVSIKPSDSVVMVGAFPPYVRRLVQNVKNLTVFDDNKSALKELGLPTEPPVSLERSLKDATVTIITGSAFVNKTIERLLELSGNAREVLVVGPTASMIPDPLFKRGVTVVGGIRITDVERMLRVVSEAGGTRALLRTCSERYTIVRN